jgi:hypothetical protein
MENYPASAIANNYLMWSAMQQNQHQQHQSIIQQQPNVVLLPPKIDYDALQNHQILNSNANNYTINYLPHSSTQNPRTIRVRISPKLVKKTSPDSLSPTLLSNVPVIPNPKERVYTNRYGERVERQEEAWNFRLHCEHCDTEYTSRKRLENHYQKCVVLNPNISESEFTCQFTQCKKSFKTHTGFENHMWKVHQQRATPKVTEIEEGNLTIDESVNQIQAKRSIFHSIELLARSDARD